jgi:hypothetical protein
MEANCPAKALCRAVFSTLQNKPMTLKWKLFFLLCVILAHGKENTETLKK